MRECDVYVFFSKRTVTQMVTLVKKPTILNVGTDSDRDTSTSQVKPRGKKGEKAECTLPVSTHSLSQIPPETSPTQWAAED